jgi:glucose/mannose-6-phosphate isomerase
VNEGHRETVIDLDDVAAIEGLDSLDVLGTVERFGEQCREGWTIGRAARYLPDAEGLENVVVLGMGGSGISGDVVQALIEPRLQLPWRTIKSYGPLPDWVGRNSLVVAVSYSGGTEETLAAFEDAHTKGARMVAISSGGPLADVAANSGTTHVRIPGGFQPRASLGFLSLPLLAVLVEMGLVPDLQGDVDEAVGVLSSIANRCHRKVPLVDNPAKQLAVRLYERVAVIYGGFGPGAVAAYRFKCDLNEYGKVPAFANLIPELNHNEIVGWSGLRDLTSKQFTLVLLRDSVEHPRVSLRFEVTEQLVRDAAADVVTVESEGKGALCRLFSLILVTQLTAIYVGLSGGVDPGPVTVIEDLKNQLAQR